jgi:hypothetical protein
MPTVNIKRTPPPPEGEYCGVIEKVASSFTKAGEPRFSFGIRTKDGKVIKDSLYFGDNVTWRIPQLCKSANLVRPDNDAPFSLTPDDLEGRVVYFGVKYNPGEADKVYVNINYHAMSFALQQNPALAGQFPPQTPRHLREVPTDNLPPESEPPDAPPTAGGPSVSPVSPPLVSPDGVGVAEAEDDKITPKQYAEAINSTANGRKPNKGEKPRRNR